MDRARQEGTNLATPEFVLGLTREYSPARYRDRFTKESEIIGMFFLQGKQPGPLYVDIVVSVDRKLVYFHVWDT